MKYSVHENTLTIFLAGRIDTANVGEKEAEVNEFLAEHKPESLILDAKELEYISSAGLRMVLRLRKQFTDMKIINVSTDVYEIFSMTGFAEMIDISKAMREVSVEGCPVIGRGAKGSVLRLDPETIIKVYHNPDCLDGIQRERELARKAFVLGIPTAMSYDVVQVGTSYGSVFELLDACSLSQALAAEPAKIDEYVTVFTELLKTIHETQVKPGDMPDYKRTVEKWLETDAPYLENNCAEKLRSLINAVSDTMNMLHCDYHTNNIMIHNHEPLLIDMDTLSHGHPVFELANIHIAYVGFGESDPKIVEEFLGISYTTACEFWKKFLPQYFGTNDTTKLVEQENKIRLLSYARLMRHTVRRHGNETDSGKKTIAMCKENIEKLLNTVNTLEF